jgi:capsular exopolysaccharide synthesis family protein
MDGIQPFTGPPRVPALTAPAPDPTLVKTPADYLRSVRRRVWMILAIGVPLSVIAAVMTVRQPNVYRASAEITIEPPQYDPILSSLVSHEIGGRDSGVNTTYVPDRIAMVRSKALAEQALNDPAVAQPSGATDEAVLELLNNLQYRQVAPQSRRFQVTLEGTDPARTAKLLYTLLDLFQSDARHETERRNEASRVGAETSLNSLNQDLKKLDTKIYEILTNSTTIGPGGKSLAEERYLTIGSALVSKRSRMGEFQQQAWIAQMFPNPMRNPTDPVISGRLGEAERTAEELTGRLQEIRRRVRNFNSDPSAKANAAKLKQVMETIDRYRAVAARNTPAADPSEAIVAQMREEIKADEETAQTLLRELQESMPKHQEFLTHLDERKQKFDRIMTMNEKLSNFEILAQSQKNPVSIPAMITEPTVPVRPRRALNIALGVIFSFGLGIGLVCLLEHIDHSVKVPEHLAMGLTLPLLGVIPRIRRTALIHRGGHLWTPGVPESVEADAYRNLRASLIGSSARHGPIVTLLVTSAKAGEGKSTTALNLAATCARAGERTLLMDVDLRRPSLAGVFREDEDDHHLGLVDVLKGDLPWQRTVARTSIPNLDFLATGDTRDIPIEILGTVELRQLIIALSHHYDRVILDGPAVLGLPDSRMLGPFVDAALLVVRSGTHELRPLRRAKAFLEQSNVVLAGVVFNGLYEDLENWSSYGPNTPYAYPEITSGDVRTPGRAGGLAAPTDEPLAALPTAGSARA